MYNPDDFEWNMYAQSMRRVGPPKNREASALCRLAGFFWLDFFCLLFFIKKKSKNRRRAYSGYSAFKYGKIILVYDLPILMLYKSRSS